MYLALQRLHPDPVLVDANTVTADMVVASALYEAGQTFELRTIRFIVEVLGREDLAYRAMDGAAHEKHCGTHWMRAVYAIAGPQSCRLSAVRVAVERMVGNDCLLDRVKYLIRVCCEPNAKQVALETVPPYAGAAIAVELASWDPTADDEHDEASQQPLHPFLLDPRVQRWAIRDLFNCSPKSSWAVEAAYQHDLPMLEVIHDTPAVPDYTHSSHSPTMDAEGAQRLLSFEGARAAAIRAGSLKMLQWLLTHVDLPVESTLLDEAVFYDQREIAEWLAEHHSEACTKVQWATTHSKNYYTQRFHVSEDLLEWLEETPTVRNTLDFGGVVGFLVQRDDVASLRRLHAFDSDLVVARGDLLTLAKQSTSPHIEVFLREIGYLEE